jgi:hypothetical protein
MSARRNHSWGAPDREDHQLTVRICDHCKTRMLTDKSRASEGIYVTRYASAQGMPYHGKGRPPCIVTGATAGIAPERSGSMAVTTLRGAS